MIFAITPAEWMYNPIGSVHGGVAATLLDTRWGVRPHDPAVGNRVHHDRPARSLRARHDGDTGRVLADSSVVHSGRRLATAEGRLYAEADGKLFAPATTSCLDPCENRLTPLTGPGAAGIGRRRSSAGRGCGSVAADRRPSAWAAVASPPQPPRSSSSERPTARNTAETATTQAMPNSASAMALPAVESPATMSTIIAAGARRMMPQIRTRIRSA